MKFLGLELKRAKKEHYATKNLTDEDRELSLEVRRMKAEEKRMDHQRRLLQQQAYMLEEKERLLEAKARYEELRADLYGDDEEESESESDMESMVLMTFLSALQGKGGSTPSSLSQSQPLQSEGVPAPMNVNLEDEEIKELIGSIPKKFRKILAQRDDVTLRKLIRGHLPAISEQSEARAILLLREMS